jgi:hypothetical protein
MRGNLFRGAAVIAALSLAAPPLSVAQPTEPTVQPEATSFNAEHLDALLAPVALYPDALLVQVLMASTFPLQVVEASRWLKEPGNKDLQGEALAQALESLNWDPSVKSLVPFPQVVATLNSQLEWMQQLGYAFATQQADVMASVQRLRHQARASGNLATTEQQRVAEENDTIRELKEDVTRLEEENEKLGEKIADLETSDAQLQIQALGSQRAAAHLDERPRRGTRVVEDARGSFLSCSALAAKKDRHRTARPICEGAPQRRGRDARSDHRFGPEGLPGRLDEWSMLLPGDPGLLQLEELGGQTAPGRILEQDDSHLRVVLARLHDQGHDRRGEGSKGVALARGEVETETFASLQAGIPHEGLEPARGSQVAEVASLDAASQNFAGAPVRVADGPLGIDEEQSVGAAAGELAHRAGSVADVLGRTGRLGCRHSGLGTTAELLAQATELFL